MFRVSQTELGWIVEKQAFKYCFLGLHFWKVWRPFVKTSGMDSCWYHSDKKYALMNLHSEIKDNQVIINDK